MLSDSSILRHIGRQPKKTASYKQLLRELTVKGDGRREFSDRLQALVKKGELLEVDSDRYSIPQSASNRNMFVGRLSMHRDGFGFVIPQANSLNPDLKARLAGDVFIPPPATGSAMHGDQVLVEITAFRPDGRAEGRIIRPVSRAHPTVVGIFHYGHRHNYVTPMDGKVGQEIIIPPGMENPANVAPPLSAAVVGASGPHRRGQDAIKTAGETPALPGKKGKQKSADRVIGEEAAHPTTWDDLD